MWKMPSYDAYLAQQTENYLNGDCSHDCAECDCEDCEEREARDEWDEANREVDSILGK